METPNLLRQIVEKSGNKPVCMPVSNISGFLLHATILPAKAHVITSMSNKDRYDSGLLEELFVELSFYYRQSKLDKSVDNRLGKVLKALVATLNQSATITIENFFESVVDEVECFWFMISTFTDYPNLNSVLFKDKLFHTIKNSNQLNKVFKAALVRSKARTLKNELQDVFAFSTLATKLTILDILAARQELDEQWLNSLQKSTEPILKAKIAILLNPDE